MLTARRDRSDPLGRLRLIHQSFLLPAARYRVSLPAQRGGAGRAVLDARLSEAEIAGNARKWLPITEGVDFEG